MTIHIDVLFRSRHSPHLTLWKLGTLAVIGAAMWVGIIFGIIKLVRYLF